MKTRILLVVFAERLNQATKRAYGQMLDQASLYLTLHKLPNKSRRETRVDLATIGSKAVELMEMFHEQQPHYVKGMDERGGKRFAIKGSSGFVGNLELLTAFIQASQGLYEQVVLICSDRFFKLASLTLTSLSIGPTILGHQRAYQADKLTDKSISNLNKLLTSYPRLDRFWLWPARLLANRLT